MEVFTKCGIINITFDDQETFNKASEALNDLLDSIPNLVAAGINAFIDSREALRPEENVFVDFWPYHGKNLNIPKPALHVTLRPISEEDDFVNIVFPLWNAIKRAVKEDNDEKSFRIAAEELRKMADYIDAYFTKTKQKTPHPLQLKRKMK